jgi:hypothetical protein
MAAKPAKGSSVLGEIWAYRLDVDIEIQGWILLFATITAAWLFLLPCYCAGLSWAPFRRFSSWLHRRLWHFYLLMCCFNAAFMILVINWLPDWTAGSYAAHLASFASFILGNMLQFSGSIAVIIAFCVAVAFKDRIALLLGIDHISFLKCKLRDCLTCWTSARFQPIELFIWKVEDLPSADMFSANNVFVEFFLGFNEPMRTRVHKSAGSRCVVKQTMQLNFDEDDHEDMLTIFVRNQKVVGSAELGRAEITTGKLREWLRLNASGQPVEWDELHFESVPLIPRGTIWLSARPIVEDGVMEEMQSFNDFTTC